MASRSHLSRHECCPLCHAGVCQLAGLALALEAVVLQVKSCHPAAGASHVSKGGPQVCESESPLPVSHSAPSQQPRFPGSQVRSWVWEQAICSGGPDVIPTAFTFRSRGCEQPLHQVGFLFNDRIWKSIELDGMLRGRNFRAGKSDVSFSKQILHPNSVSACQ